MSGVLAFFGALGVFAGVAMWVRSIVERAKDEGLRLAREDYDRRIAKMRLAIDAVDARARAEAQKRGQEIDAAERESLAKTPTPDDVEALIRRSKEK